MKPQHQYSLASVPSFRSQVVNEMRIRGIDQNNHLPHVLFTVDMNLPAFMQKQYPNSEYSNTVIGKVVTLTGLVSYAQAATCRDYVSEHFSSGGLDLLRLLQSTLESSNKKWRGTISYIMSGT